MRIAAPLILLAVMALPACDRQSAPSVVQQSYDNRADQIDKQADAQPTDVAKKIYKSRADAVRDEGEDRKKGLEKAGITSDVPPMPAANAQ